jgi:hypothetical protein
MAYNRYFMVFSCEEDGYGFNGKNPGGRCVLEIRGSEGKLSCWAQDLKPETLYTAWLLFPDNNRFAGFNIGALPVDAKGKSEARYVVNAAAIGRFTLNECTAVIIMATQVSYPTGVLCGYKNGPVSWRNGFYKWGKEVTPINKPQFIEEPKPPVLTTEEWKALMPDNEAVLDIVTDKVTDIIETPFTIDIDSFQENEVNDEPCADDVLQPFHLDVPETDTEMEPSAKNIKALNELFNQKVAVIPFSKQNRDAKWVHITPDDSIPMPENNDLMADSFVLSAYERFGHLLLGFIEESQKPQYVIGVPDIFNPDSRLNARRLGFMQFKCCEAPQSEQGEFGYWLIFINL